MESTDVVLLIGLAIASVILVSLSFREDHQATLTQRMAAGSGLVLTHEQIPLVQDELGRRERGAMIGGIIGAAASWILTSADIGALTGPTVLLVVSGTITGSAVGSALVALFAANRRPSGSVLVARSTSVSLADYSPPAARYLARVLVLAGVGATIALLVMSNGRPVPAAIYILAASAVLTLTVFEVFGRRIALKGQPVGSVVELVLHDALRATYLRDLVVAPAVLAAYSLLIAVSTALSWIDAALPPGLALLLYSAFLVSIFLTMMTKRSRRAVPHYLRRLWPEIAASGPGSTAIIEEPTR